MTREGSRPGPHNLDIDFRIRGVCKTGFIGGVKKKEGRDDTTKFFPEKDRVEGHLVSPDGGRDVELLLVALTSPGLPDYQATHGPMASGVLSEE